MNQLNRYNLVNARSSLAIQSALFGHVSIRRARQRTAAGGVRSRLSRTSVWSVIDPLGEVTV